MYIIGTSFVRLKIPTLVVQKSCSTNSQRPLFLFYKIPKKLFHLLQMLYFFIHASNFTPKTLEPLLVVLFETLWVDILKKHFIFILGFALEMTILECLFFETQSRSVKGNNELLTRTLNTLMITSFSTKTSISCEVASNILVSLLYKKVGNSSLKFLLQLYRYS